jgi:uncharacterized membrane protein
MSALLEAATIATAAGAGLVGGVFLAFSVMVMPALAALPPAHGLAAMRRINELAVSTVFIAVFLLTAVGAAGLLVAGFTAGGTRVTLPLGAASYLLGAFGLTLAYNVPRNDRLAHDDAFWTTYLREWTAANHVRGLFALGATVLLASAVAA